MNIISPHSQIILQPDSACGVAFGYTVFILTLSTVTGVALFPHSECLFCFEPHGSRSFLTLEYSVSFGRTRAV